MENLEEWSCVMEEKMARFDDVVNRLKSAISVGKKEETKAKYEENIIQEEMFRRTMQGELKIQEMKLPMKSKEYEKRDKIVNEERVNVKLPKLIKTKFYNMSLDWFLFWNQFESEIGKAEIVPVSNYSNLKELLIPIVRLLIDSLLFTSEGYSRAKSILLGKFGESTEIAAAHIQCITSMPVAQILHPNRIHDFYEKLVISVQALDTMNKLKKINGYVKLTLDKLPGIRADLVRIDEVWQEWSFLQHVDALTKWTTRNPKIILTPEKSFKRETVYQAL